jgi:Leucine-rich repeat (LRR) protein
MEFLGTSLEDPCLNDWQGVGCSCTSSSSTCQISQLLLSNHSLYGTLPSSVGNLNYLTDLRLSNNNITGLLPNSIGNFTALHNLDLRYNIMNGPLLSSSFSYLTSLEILNLQFNYFTFYFNTS